ncbi:hypothetical protein [Methylosinus sp. LW4]|uniref:hypothetical protein n=1 Tax=Methylosinus sp. LW4 TaxID=136993 RepID=UPI000378B788|nr:hypothetical protein [Methylosinus sp. LW4]
MNCRLIARAVALTLLAAATLPTAPAAARDALLTRLTQPNTPTVFYFHSFRVNCQGVPNYRLAQRATVVSPQHPEHGTLTIGEGQAPVRHCQGQPGYATIVTYTPEHNFTGYDSFVLNVAYHLENRTVLQHLTARIQVGGPANPR